MTTIRIHEGESFRVTIRSHPDDFNAILDTPELVDVEFFATFKDAMLDEQGAFIQETATLPAFLHDDGSITFEREYFVQGLLPPHLSPFSESTLLVPVVPWIALAVILALLAATWNASNQAASVLREPLEIVAKKITPEQVGAVLDTAQDISDTVRTLAVALVVALIIAKVA